MSEKRSPEAIARRNAKKNARRAAKRAERRTAAIASLQCSVSKTSPEYRRRLPVFQESSKDKLRSILTQAVLNTGGRV